MGLLDDAIRDHLELKRRRGADPGEVAREQRDALSARVRVTRRDSGGYESDDGIAPEVVASAPRPRSAGDDVRDQLVMGQATSSLDQETAEFDMTSVLNEGGESRQEEFPARRRIAGSGAQSAALTELPDDSLDWDFPPADAEQSDDRAHVVGQDSQTHGGDPRSL